MMRDVKPGVEYNEMSCGRHHSSQIPSPDPYTSRTLKPGNDIPPNMKPGDGMLHNDKPDIFPSSYIPLNVQPQRWPASDAPPQGGRGLLRGPY